MAGCFWAAAMLALTITAPAHARVVDTDHDRMSDRWERAHRLRVGVRDGNRDADRDGLTNLKEYRRGTDPWRADTDRDGMPDAWEVRHRLDPRDSRDARRDPDHDGAANLREYRRGSDPRRAPAAPAAPTESSAAAVAAPPVEPAGATLSPGPAPPADPAPAERSPVAPPPPPAAPLQPIVGPDLPAGPDPVDPSAPAGPLPGPPTQLDAAAQQATADALSVVRDLYAPPPAYPAASVLATAIAQAAPPLLAHEFVADQPGSSGPGDVSVSVEDAGIVTLCARSGTGRFYCRRDDRARRLGAARRDATRVSSGVSEADARCILPLQGVERSCVSATGVAAFTSQLATAAPRTTVRSFVFYAALDAGPRRLRDHGSQVGVLAPFWWTLDPAAQTVDPAKATTPRKDQDVILGEQQRQGFALWPAFSATNTAEGNAALQDPAARRRMIDVVRAVARAYHVPGVTMDMEGMSAADRDAYSAFITELATGLHADQRGLAVYSMRRTTADDSAVGTGARAYDWAVLARAADLLLVSGYNESPASRPGPVSTTDGFQAVVGYAASVARANVVPLVAQYGYWWPTASGGTRTLLATQDAETERLTQGLAGTPSDGSMSYVRPDGSVVWYETADGAAARVRQTQASGMAWWGLFSMGREPDAFWSSIP